MSRKKIAYLVLAHTDPCHIYRLANKLKETGDVYIHIDLKSDINIFKDFPHIKNVKFINKRYKVNWGGYNSIKATMSLLENAINSGEYRRYILLQGLDYPIWSDKKIIGFFNNNNYEYIRGCNISKSTDPYFTHKITKKYFFDVNNRILRIFLREFFYNIAFIRNKKNVILGNKKCDIFYGSALWAITNECAEYIMEVYKNDTKYNNYMKHMFAPDESYFHTIIFNSIFSEKTIKGGPEPEKRYLVNWRNLHIFNYDSSIKIYTENDFDYLINSDAMFFRKATTGISDSLLDKIDDYRMNKF